MKIEEDIRKIIIKDIKNLGYILWGLELSGKSNSKHIRIYKDTNHGHEAQQPKEWSSN